MAHSPPASETANDLSNMHIVWWHWVCHQMSSHRGGHCTENPQAGQGLRTHTKDNDKDKAMPFWQQWAKKTTKACKTGKALTGIALQLVQQRNKWTNKQIIGVRLQAREREGKIPGKGNWLHIQKRESKNKQRKIIVCSRESRAGQLGFSKMSFDKGTKTMAIMHFFLQKGTSTRT